VHTEVMFGKIFNSATPTSAFERRVRLVVAS